MNRALIDHKTLPSLPLYDYFSQCVTQVSAFVDMCGVGVYNQDC